jgi:integrase
MSKKNFLPRLYPLDRDMGKTWFIKHTDPSGRPAKTYGRLNHLHTIQEREKEAERLLAILKQPAASSIKQRQDLISNLSAVLEYKRPEFATKTYQCYFSHLKYFSAWYRTERVKRPDVSAAEYIRHMHEAGYHNNYKIKAKIFIGSLFKKMVSDGLYDHNPFAEVKIKKVKGQSLLAFHPDQVKALKKIILAADPQLWDAIEFEYYLFFRPIEIRQLKISNILFEEMKVDVGSKITKDNDVLQKAIPEPMRATILKFKGYPPDYYIFSSNGLPGPKMLGMNAFNKRHRKFLDKLQISHRYAFYSWVHTGAKNAAMAGIPMKQLQLQKGHHDLEMFNEYLKNIGVDDCTQLIAQFPAI